MAPELLLEMEETGERTAGTVWGDIYQLGMLIYQILFSLMPFHQYVDSMSVLIDRIVSRHGEPPLHPTIPEESEYTMRLLSIMQQCWLPRETSRPTLVKISDALQREFGQDAKGTLIDQMIKMIDEYSANLEKIVERRTREIEELNEKTERLLYQIMPRSIASELREGRAVRPTMHPSASVLFADVCQFTSLCENSIPIQIILMLNTLYSRFDTLVEELNAFKVENVGDAYLVVSGIPEVEENRHLHDICLIALRLQKFVKEEYVVPHRPDHKLQIKVGIHSGGLASGILGSTAPRFCVFGDTVTMASKMGSTCEPGKIQMSETTASMVTEKYTQFVIVERGVVHIKGKGPCTTFYLQGEATSPTA